MATYEHTFVVTQTITSIYEVIVTDENTNSWDQRGTAKEMVSRLIAEDAPPKKRTVSPKVSSWLCAVGPRQAS